MPADLVVIHAGELLTCPVAPALPAAAGSSADAVSPAAALGLIPDGALAVEEGRVMWTGPTPALDDHAERTGATRVIDAGGRVVMPGLVECHTHLVFGGDRAEEFQLRVGGLSYEEIWAAGGGIMSTVRATRTASWDELLAASLARLDTLMAHGVTTVEAKSGYGLRLEDELRLLSLAAECDRRHDVAVMSTFLGAHSVPEERRTDRDAYVSLVIEEMLPAVEEQGVARFCDVFCEEGAFSVEESRMVLEAGVRHGLRPKIHADQLTGGGGAELAAELGAASADHLDRVGEGGIAALADAGVPAVLLPGAVFFLGRREYAPARRLLAAGVPVALSTDLNPGTCFTENPFLIGTIASCSMGMTAAEVVRGLTVEAARALALETEVGSLEPGRQADLVVLETDRYLTLPYHFGIDPVRTVVKSGRVVHDRGETGGR